VPAGIQAQSLVCRRLPQNRGLRSRYGYELYHTCAGVQVHLQKQLLVACSAGTTQAPTCKLSSRVGPGHETRVPRSRSLYRGEHVLRP
jgi:hypothetical protein